jgi:hypothetical protein
MRRVNLDVKPEARHYDDALQCELLLREWFGCMGFVLAHDPDARLLRLYPPGEGGGEADEDGVKRLVRHVFGRANPATARSSASARTSGSAGSARG